MTISRDMIAAARRAGRRHPDASVAAGNFFRSQLRPDGGFADRAGKSDLYYTVFGLLGLRALQLPLPAAATAAYLANFGDGHGLDMLHLSCLARCWACLAPTDATGPNGGLAPADFAPRDSRGADSQVATPLPPADLPARVLERLDLCRTPDGGYGQRPGEQAGSAYGCFLALGAMQDLGAPPSRPAGMIQCLNSLHVGQGAYANDAALPIGSVPATAAAATVLHYLGQAPAPQTAEWLRAQQDAGGGFLAIPPAPQADLLSTATALHALALLEMGTDSRRGGCLSPFPAGAQCVAFVRSLQRPGGGFAGHGEDQTPDCEYTFYGLLALGDLSG